MASSSSPAAMATLFELAARQHDVILTRQLRDLALSAKAIARMARVGWLVPVRPGAWTTCRHPSAWQQAVAAALLAGPGSALSHTTAARIHRFGHLHAGPKPEITVIYPGNRRLSGVSVHRVACLERADLQTSRGVAVTTPARTLVDLAGRLPGTLLVKVLDEALVSRAVSAEGVEEALSRSRSRPGAQVLRRLIDQRLGRPPAESLLEVRVLEVLAPLEPFQVQFQLILDGQLMILDIAWPDRKVAVECDGWAAHGRSRSRFDRDRRRDNLLAAHGWTVVHVTSAMSDREILDAALGILVRRRG